MVHRHRVNRRGSCPVVLRERNEQRTAVRIHERFGEGEQQLFGLFVCLLSQPGGAGEHAGGTKIDVHVHATLAPDETLTVTVRFAPAEMTPFTAQTPHWPNARPKRRIL
jgi:hypothetical protein